MVKILKKSYILKIWKTNYPVQWSSNQFNRGSNKRKKYLMLDTDIDPLIQENGIME